jgi:cytochrome c6
LVAPGKFHPTTAPNDARAGTTRESNYLFIVMKKTLALTLLAATFAAAASLGYAATAAENWDNNCAKCHGADGSGNTKMGKKLKLKDYTDAQVQANLKDDEMAKAIKEGVSEDGKQKMKAFKDDFSDAEITELVAYIRAMKK